MTSVAWASHWTDHGRLLALPLAPGFWGVAFFGPTPQILRKLGCNILCLLATNPRNIRYHTLR